MLTSPELYSSLANVAAPMVNQSDLPFRMLVRRYNTTLVYTQMLLPERLLNDQEYLEFHLRGMGGPFDRPVVAQLCGNEPEIVVKAARQVQSHCDAIDLNLGCPQDAAREAHIGAYLLGQKDWPVVTDIVSAMAQSLTVPVSAKLRLCQPATLTVDLARRLEAAGASWLTLHARHVSSRRRRQGAADLSEVKSLKEALSIPVLSNGNVRTYSDVESNRQFTGADGIMVGETLLSNPCLFADKVPDPVCISLEYLDLCHEHVDTATLETVQAHVRHFVDYQCGRRPWFNKFRNALSDCKTLAEIERLLRYKVQRWRGLTPLVDDVLESSEDEEHVDGSDVLSTAADMLGQDLQSWPL